ncbi:MAG: hypothetical protein J1F68_06170 [Clostridiales bacterium]|nr:hypothetical protein [Clostridiales bacterium]
MVLNLIADGLSVGALIGLIILGVVVLACAIFGIVLKARDLARKPKRVKQKRVKKSEKAEELVPVTVVQENHYDFSNLTEEEKKLIRIYRDKTN